MPVRFVVMIVAGLLLSSTAFDTDARATAATSLAKDLLAAGKPVTVVCFGDSITGVYYHTGGRRAYPEILEIALRKAYPNGQVKVINAGISGHTTREALARLERDVLKHKPRLVTVMFGMNDMVRVPFDEFKKNMIEIKVRCQNAGAEVLFCTQNNVMETPGRPNKKLAEITQIIRELAKAHKIAVADCHAAYEMAKIKNAADWRLLLSDEIHPNMDGHKLMAGSIAEVILGTKVSLEDVGPLTPAVPHTLQRLKAGQPIKVLAMPPYDKVIGAALKALNPKAKVEVTTWTTEGLTLPQIEASAKRVRGMKVDLVIVAIPATADAPDLESRIRSYSWILNWSLSFGHQQWDVIAVPPSTASPVDEQRDRLAQRLIAAQDLTMIVRRPGEDNVDLQAVVLRWLKDQTKAAEAMDYIDAHVHVWTPDITRYPLAPGFKKEDMKPVSFTPEELFKHCKPAGVGRINLIQMSYYGFDNSYMLDVIAKHPDMFVGTAVINPFGKDPETQMGELAKKGVRAFRIYPKLTEESIEKWLRPEGYKKMFAAGARNNQAMACLIGPDALPELDRMCKEFPDSPVIIDHLARIGTDGEIRAADVDRLCAMAKHKRVMVKIGAFYALGKKQSPYTDLAPLIKKVVAAFGPRRCMWESDCPFQVQGDNTYQASVDLVLRRLDFLSEDDKDWLLRKTAEGFFFAK